MSIKNENILDVNPLSHITSDIAISQANYESVLNGLVQWDNSKNDTITIRLATRSDPYFVDYVLHTKYYYDKNYGVINSDILLPVNMFSYENRVNLSATSDDEITLRVNVANDGDTTWTIYENVIVYDEIIYDNYYDDEGKVVPDSYYILRPSKFTRSYPNIGMFFRTYDNTLGEMALYQTLVPIDIDHDFPVTESSNGYLVDSSTSINLAKRVCRVGSALNPGATSANQFLLHYCTQPSYNKVYLHTVDSSIDSRKPFYDPSSGYEYYCDVYDSNVSYIKGTLVYHMGDFFICRMDNASSQPMTIFLDESSIVCTYNTEVWSRVLPITFTRHSITSSSTINTTVTTDVDGFILRNTGVNESSEKTSISIIGSISIPGESTEQPTGVNIITTSNYANWPDFSARKWSAGSTYFTTAEKSAFDKQDYSAVMVFKHYGDEENFKYKNIVNYDGPDLDQGLCIMLPVTIIDDERKNHDPLDGNIIEFLFNIWPNHEYDGRYANDLIINKSQIYVYSVPNYGEYLLRGFNVNTVEPIAKFSMARLTNFYVFSENVGVPDKPVCYKARFIYSKKEHRWKTYDYYQFPDHVFLSPNGFVNPSDRNSYGVETSGFPLYQNPFSDYDLSALHVADDYRNQIQNK